MPYIQKYPTKKILKDFHNYLKQFPDYQKHKVSVKPLINKFIDGVGRPPTEEELRKYVVIVIIPTDKRQLRLRQIKSLKRLINTNNEKNNRKRFKNPDQLYVG